MKILIQNFAILKDYFSSSLEIELGDTAKTADAIQALKELNPKASNVLDSCRIAVDETLVSRQFDLQEGATLFLLPPSSGG